MGKRNTCEAGDDARDDAVMHPVDVTEDGRGATTCATCHGRHKVRAVVKARASELQVLVKSVHGPLPCGQELRQSLQEAL
eukprot:12232766-Alexandrium_andersonii.AAC.1